MRDMPTRQEMKRERHATARVLRTAANAELATVRELWLQVSQMAERAGWGTPLWSRLSDTARCIHHIALLRFPAWQASLPDGQGLAICAAHVDANTCQAWQEERGQ